MTRVPLDTNSGSTSAPAQPGARIRGLDGLRAISIAFVLLGHLAGTKNFQHPAVVAAVHNSIPLASMGVRIFFVISGFLITSLLIEEERRTGTVDLSRFYFRRTLRIFPPFYVYIAAVMILEAMGRISLRPGDLLHAATYTTNFHHDRAWHLGHTWSLAVEEQFYLLWPVLYRGARHRRITLLVSYIIAAPIWRLAMLCLLPESRAGIGETFFTTADSIAMGCLLALTRPVLLNHRLYRRIIDSSAYLLIVPVLFVVGSLERHAKLDVAFCMSAQNLLIAIFIERVTRTSHGVVSSVLNNRAVVLVGVWSYSIYLWQQLVLDRNVQDSAFTAFPLNLILAMALAATSYYLVEKPALRLRQRLETRLFPRRPARIVSA
jgi:peptidoglycan/LPS O-acetylase OafA/YrhL